jgi:hypothetical protein
MTYAQILWNYQHKTWSAQMVATAVRAGIITKVQYNTITGLVYPATV